MKYYDIFGNFKEKNKEPNNKNQLEKWVIAFQKKVKKDNFGIAIGTYNEDEKIAYEAWADFEYSKNLKIIPVIFIKETNFGEETGFAINTKFSY